MLYCQHHYLNHKCIDLDKVEDEYRRELRRYARELQEVCDVSLLESRLTYSWLVNKYYHSMEFLKEFSNLVLNIASTTKLEKIKLLTYNLLVKLYSTMMSFAQKHGFTIKLDKDIE